MLVETNLPIWWCEGRIWQYNICCVLGLLLHTVRAIWWWKQMNIILMVPAAWNLPTTQYFLEKVSNNNFWVQIIANHLPPVSIYSGFCQSICSKLADETIYCWTIISLLHWIVGLQFCWRICKLMLWTPRNQQKQRFQISIWWIHD